MQKAGNRVGLRGRWSLKYVLLNNQYT